MTIAPRLAVDFVQTFTRGAYHDRGRKHLELAREGDHLVVVREEMLESLLVDSNESRCVESKAPAAPGLVLRACLIGEKKRPYVNETKRQVTLANDGATVELGEVGSGMEWSETWRIEGVVRAKSKAAVVLVREATTEAGDEYFSHEVRILSLPTLAQLWRSSGKLLDFHLTIAGTRIDIDAKRDPDVMPPGGPSYDDLVPSPVHLVFDGKQVVEK